MRLLYITPAPPDRLDRDGMTQVAAMVIRQLGKTNAIDVWTLTETPSEVPTIDGARNVTVFSATPTSLLKHYLQFRQSPFFLERTESPTLHQAITSLDTAAYDLVIFHTPFVLQYTADCRLPFVAQTIDALSDWFMRTADRTTNPLKRFHLRTEGHRATDIEHQALRRARGIIVVGEADAQTLHHAAPNIPTAVIPIGINTDIFAPSTAPRDPATIIMTGIMTYPPNIDAATWFVQTVWPHIHQQHPGATFRIVGRQPTPAVLALQKVPGVIVTGQVPSMAAELQRATLAVSPLRFGTGYKIKINEALACGTPLIASRPSIAGVGVTAGVECLVANEPAEWIAAIHRLLDSPTERQALGQRATQFMTTRSWPHVAAEYQKTYVRFLGAKHH